MTGQPTFNPENSVQALVLDVGNVVLELDFDKFLNAFGLPEKKKLIHNPFDEWTTYDAFERGHLNQSEFHSELIERLGEPLQFDDFTTKWNQLFVGETKGISELLPQVKVPLFALTNSNSIHIEHAVETFPVMKMFERVFTSYELGCRKPEPEIYQKVTNEISFAPSQILFIDDNPENVKSAQNFGFHCTQLRNDCSKMKDVLKHFDIL